MKLDLQTLFWVLNLSYATSILFALILSRLSGHFPGAGLWILAQVFAAGGALLFAERAILPYPLLVAGNVLFVAAEINYAHAAWAYRIDRRFPFALYSLLPAVAIALLFTEHSPANIRNVIVAIGMGSMSGWTAYLLVHRIPKRYRYAAVITALPFFLIAAGDLALVMLSLAGPPRTRFEELGTGHALVYLLSIATAYFSLLGFFLLATQRRQFLLERQGKELERMNEELREAGRVKDLFVSMLAHDLRGPVSGSARYARKHLLGREVDLDSKRQALEIVVAALEKASDLLDKLLLWSRNQRDDGTIRLERIDLADAAKTMIDLFVPTLGEKSIALAPRLESAFVLAERESLDIVLRNMISNAVKFSPIGQTVDIETGRKIDGSVFVAVMDRGSGIPEDQVERLFRIDARFTSPGTMGETGTGLGLILCADYAARMGAEFSISARKGGGTVVRLDFPDRPPGKPE